MLKLRGLSVRRAAVVAAIAPLLMLAACGGSDSDGTSTKAVSADSAIAKAPSGAFDAKKATGSAVTIGLMNPEGGPTIDEPDARVASEAVVKYANEHLGGIGGHVIKLDICKSKEDAASATACANQFVQNKDAGVIIVDTSQGGVAAPIISKAGLAYGSYAVLGPELQLPGVFAWTGGVAVQTAAMAKAAKAAGAKALSLFVIDVGNVAAGISALAVPTFKAIGVDLKVVAIPQGTPDATSQVAAGLKDKPGAIGIIGDGTTCASTLKGLTTAGFTGQKFVIQQCLVPSVISSVGNALDGAFNLGWNDTVQDNDEANLYKAIMAKYAPGTKLDNYAPSGYQSTLGFIRAASAGIGSNDPTPANILAAIKAAKDVPLPIGAGVTMTCDGTQVPGIPAICGNETISQTLDAKGGVTKESIIK